MTSDHYIAKAVDAADERFGYPLGPFPMMNPLFVEWLRAFSDAVQQPIADALNTAERDDALVVVARDAYRAECELMQIELHDGGDDA